jgi:hypothetical protein
MKRIYLSAVFSTLFFWTFGQQENIITKVKVEDFSNSTKNIDTSKNAVILFDIGNLDFVGNSNNWVSYQYKKHIRVKINNKNGFGIAT